MDFQVCELGGGGEWEMLVNAAEKKTLYHSTRWLEIAKKHTGTKLHYLVCEKGSEKTAILPVFTKKNKGLNLVFSPPTKTGLPYLGPILCNTDPNAKTSTLESSFINSVDAFTSHIQKNIGANYQLLTTIPGISDVRSFSWQGYNVKPEYTYICDLSVGADTLFQNYKKQARTDIKKTIKEGVEVRLGGMDELKMIHESLEARFVQQGLATNITYEYLKDLYDEFKDDFIQLFCAYHKNEFVGGFISVSQPDRASYWVGGSKNTVKGIYPNDLLQWEAMQWAIQKGYKKYEIVGAVDPRLRQFKSKFNPKLVLWYSIEKYNPSILKIVEKTARTVYGKLGLGGLA